MRKAPIIVLIGIIIVRLLLLNVNATEVGDSYNLLTAGEALKHWNYPLTEKRLPLLPLLLSFNHWIDPLFFGRFLMVVISLGTLWLSLKTYEHISVKKKMGWAVLLLLATQPLWAYWSMRIMTDVLFGFLLMLIMYLLLVKDMSKTGNILVIGLLTGLAAQTRFEGFLLVAAYGLYLLTQKNWRHLVSFILPVGLVVLPFFLRNFLNFGSLFYSAYANEAKQYLPEGRLIFIFFAYLIFLMGPLSVWFVRRGLTVIRGKELKQVLPFVIFLFLFVPLIGIWTAAVPRLFYSLVPMMAILLILGLETLEKVRKEDLILVAGFIVLFVVLAGIFRIDFLTGSLGAMACLGVLSILGLLALWRLPNFRNLFVIIMLCSNLVVAGSVIYQAKDRSKTTLEGVQYALRLNGLVGYADETGVSSWYLRQKGLYWNGDTGYTEALDWMRDNQVKYLVVTNESYEEGAQFLVVYDSKDEDKFSRLQRFERKDGIDPINLILEKAGLRKPKDLPVKYTEVYEILSYREDRD